MKIEGVLGLGFIGFLRYWRRFEALGLEFGVGRLKVLLLIKDPRVHASRRSRIADFGTFWPICCCVVIGGRKAIRLY